MRVEMERCMELRENLDHESTNYEALRSGLWCGSEKKKSLSETFLLLNADFQSQFGLRNNVIESPVYSSRGVVAMESMEAYVVTFSNRRSQAIFEAGIVERLEYEKVIKTVLSSRGHWPLIRGSTLPYSIVHMLALFSTPLRNS